MLVEYPKPSNNKIANVGSIHILLLHAATGFDEWRQQKDVSELKTLFFRSNRVILVRLYTTSSHKVKTSTICTNKHYANITTI